MSEAIEVYLGIILRETVDGHKLASDERYPRCMMSLAELTPGSLDGRSLNQ